MEIENVRNFKKTNESIVKKNNQLQIDSSVLRNAIKRGVYKELYKKHMLTSQQLNDLLAYMK